MKTNKAADTPRTDAALKETQGLFRASAATNGFADFARTLERENAVLREALDDLLTITNHELGEFTEDEVCTAGDDMCGDLCGHSLCNAIGCVRDKLVGAKAALAKAAGTDKSE